MLCSAQLLLSYERIRESLPFLPCNGARKDKAGLTIVLRFPALGSWETSSGIGSSRIISDGDTEIWKWNYFTPRGCLRYFTWISKSCQGVVAHVCNPSWRQRQENREFFVSIEESRTEGLDYMRLKQQKQQKKTCTYF